MDIGRKDRQATDATEYWNEWHSKQSAAYREAGVRWKSVVYVHAMMFGPKHSADFKMHQNKMMPPVRRVCVACLSALYSHIQLEC